MRRLTDGLSFSSFLCHSDFRSFLLVSASYSYSITPHSFIPGLKPFLLQILPTVASFFFFRTDSTDSTKSPLSFLSVLPHPLISSYPPATPQRSSDTSCVFQFAGGSVRVRRAPAMATCYLGRRVATGFKAGAVT